MAKISVARYWGRKFVAVGDGTKCSGRPKTCEMGHSPIAINQSIFSQPKPKINSVQGSQTKRKYALKKPHAMRLSGGHAAGTGAWDEMCCESSTRTVTSSVPRPSRGLLLTIRRGFSM